VGVEGMYIHEGPAILDWAVPGSLRHPPQTGGTLPVLRRSGATHDVEDIFEEIGRVFPAPPQGDLTVLAVAWTPQCTGVLK
jgi:hypothetical protein